MEGEKKGNENVAVRQLTGERKRGTELREAKK